MNIFHVNDDPKLAAKDLCNEHVIKMILESAQMLCSAFKPGDAPYKRTHYNHPSTIWTRTSLGNYEWLIEHAFELGNEHISRYKPVRPHKSLEVIRWCSENKDKIEFIDSNKSLTQFAQCMPDKYKIINDPVQAYKNFYVGEKSSFATWEPYAKIPSWYKDSLGGISEKNT